MREDALAGFQRHELRRGAVAAMAEGDASDRVIDGGQWVIAAEHWRVVREEFTHALWPAIAV
jgi:hypothetical protein